MRWLALAGAFLLGGCGVARDPYVAGTNTVSSGEWKIERTALPSISQIIHEQTKLGEPEPQAAVEARYRTQL